MRRQNILILGGGIAGLAAAGELARGGRHVTLLEAGHRLGGRILTAGSGAAPVELGAEFIHGGNQEFWRILKVSGLKTTRVPNRFHRWENGRLRRTDLWNEVEKVMAQIDPQKPDQSFARFLEGKKFSAATKRLAMDFVEGFDAADPRKIGVRGLAAGGEEEPDDPGAHQFRIRRGYSALIDFLERQARRHGVTIKRDCAANTIAWKTGRVQVGAVDQGRKRSFEAHAAVVTLPLGVLKAGRVRFQPALPEKEEAIARLEFGNVIKVVLRFKKVFWRERNFGFVVTADESIPTWWSDDRGILLTGWAGGPKADRISQWPRTRLKTIALQILSRIFHVPIETVQEAFLELHVHDWRKDRFIGGAYSYVPVNGADLPEQLAAPVGNTLFFAGEATASGAQPGTVHGAFSSGLRAAREVLLH